MKKLLIGIILLVLVLFSGPIVLSISQANMGKAWYQATNESAEIAPKVDEHKDAVVQIYAARAWGWRGAFSVHSWISIKPTNAKTYTVYQVVGWRKYHNQPVLSVRSDIPDRHWYGNRPTVLVDLRSEKAQEVIDQIDVAVQNYPWPSDYRMWPGPNSNTFVAWVIRNVPTLSVDLPPTFIGKDYLGGTNFFSPSLGGNGFQFSVFGVFGVTVGVEEGIEFNLGGANFGIDPKALALRLPGWGVIGLRKDTGVG